MSLEKAMETLAVAMTAQAAATEKHTEVMQACLDQGIAFLAPAAFAADKPSKAADAEKPAAKNKPGRKPAEKPAETKKKDEDEGDDFADDGDDDGDDFGDDEKTASSEKKYTTEHIKELLFKVKEKKSADDARAILKELGVNTIAQIPEKDFAKAVALAAKKGVKL